MKPIRIQLLRGRAAKGWKLQEISFQLNGLPAVCVARPSQFGNPFRVHEPTGHPMDLMDAQMGVCFSRSAAVKRFQRMLTPRHIIAIKKMLRGKNLACWCPLNEPCHADVLLKIANAGTPADFAECRRL